MSSSCCAAEHHDSTVTSDVNHILYTALSNIAFSLSEQDICRTVNVKPQESDRSYSTHGKILTNKQKLF